MCCLVIFILQRLKRNNSPFLSHSAIYAMLLFAVFFHYLHMKSENKPSEPLRQRA